jgi:hypothetical protein
MITWQELSRMTDAEQDAFAAEVERRIRSRELTVSEAKAICLAWIQFAKYVMR